MKLTSRIADQLIALVRDGASGPSAAAALNIAIEIYNDWLTSDPAFAGRIERTTAEARRDKIKLRDKSPGGLKGRLQTAGKESTRKKPWHKQKIDGLTSKQRRFVHEYNVDHNGQEAATRAGYSKRSAASIAARLRGQPNITAAIKAHDVSLLAHIDITAERTLREVANIAYMDPGEFYDAKGRPLPIKQLPEDARHALAGWEEKSTKSGSTVRKIRLADKMRAFEFLGRHFGMSDETRRIELTGRDGAPIEMNLNRPRTDEERRATR